MGGTPVPSGFSYNSGDNEHFLTVAELRQLIQSHVDQAFNVQLKTLS